MYMRHCLSRLVNLGYYATWVLRLLGNCWNRHTGKGCTRCDLIRWHSSSLPLQRYLLSLNSFLPYYTLHIVNLCSNGCPDVLNEFFFWLVGFEISGLLTLILLVVLLGIGVRMSFISPTVCTF